MNCRPERPEEDDTSADFGRRFDERRDRAVHMRIAGRNIALPRSRLLRIALGSALVVLGLFFGFLPVLGYWMVPVGLLVLSYDIAVIRRLRRRVVLWWNRRKAK